MYYQIQIPEQRRLYFGYACIAGLLSYTLASLGSDWVYNNTGYPDASCSISLPGCAEQSKFCSASDPLLVRIARFSYVNRILLFPFKYTVHTLTSHLTNCFSRFIWAFLYDYLAYDRSIAVHQLSFNFAPMTDLKPQSQNDHRSIASALILPHEPFHQS